MGRSQAGGASSWLVLGVRVGAPWKCVQWGCPCLSPQLPGMCVAEDLWENTAMHVGKALSLRPRNCCRLLALHTPTGCVTLGKSLGPSEPSFLIVTPPLGKPGGQGGLVGGKVLRQYQSAGCVGAWVSCCNRHPYDPALGSQGILGLVFRTMGWPVMCEYMCEYILVRSSKTSSQHSLYLNFLVLTKSV